MACVITVTDFKDLFDRGQFVYGTTIPDVRDKDIEEAIAETECVFNEDLIDDEDCCKKAKLYLTAHFLTLDLETDGSGGKSVFIQQSRSADGISESLAIPDWMKDGDFAMYVTTYYGQKYLMICKPYLDGAVFVSQGATLP